MKTDPLHGLAQTQLNTFLDSFVSLMETFQRWSSLHCTAYVLLLFFSIASEGSGCEAPSSPLCFKGYFGDSVYKCEWSLKSNRSDVTFDLHFSKVLIIKNIKTTWWEINEEQLVTGETVDNWVVAHVGNSSCSSPRQPVELRQAVKFDAPKNLSVSWLKNNLSLKWDAAEEFPASAEILYGQEEPSSKSGEESQTLINTTCKASKYHVTVVNLLKNVSYHVKIRHHSTQVRNPLWSDWSPVVIVPAELEQKPNVSSTTKLVNGTRKVMLSWEAMPRAASVRGIQYVVNDTQSSQRCPCKHKQHITDVTRYTLYVSHAPVNISIIAKNAAGDSPPATVHLPAVPLTELKICKNTSLDEKLCRRSCLECYELQDEDSGPRFGKTISRSKTQKEIRKSIHDYVRYLYFKHTCIGGKPQTVDMCLFYQKEGAPNIKPPDFEAISETHTSVNLSWTAIPLKHQRGFLTHYVLCSMTSSPPGEQKDCFNLTSGLNFYLDKLMPGTKYSISLAGVTRVGKGPEAIVMINTKPEKPVNVGLSFGLLIFFFLFSTMCTIILKRIKKKMFPTVPKPVIPNLSSYQPERQEIVERKEEVNDLTLLPLQPLGRSICEETEAVTVLRRGWDHGSDEDMEYERSDSEGSDDEGLSPGCTEKTLRISEEGELKDLEQMDTELAMLIYKNRLVFDVKTDST